MDRLFLRRYAWLSVGAAVATICLKTTAFALTGSVGLLSDAAESLVNLAGAVIALGMLTIAARPPDEEHAFGHDKAEYFSSGAEAMLILVAACSIAYAAVGRLLRPEPLGALGIGLAVAVAAAAINFLVARSLLRAGRKCDSIALEADARHLMTDVWTSVGVVAALGAVAVTGFEWLDPVIALVVAANIGRAAVGLLRQTISGLMDVSLPADDLAVLARIADRYRLQGLQVHELRTRRAASRRFVSFHALVPGSWTVRVGHELLERAEDEMRRELPGIDIVAHLEPADDVAP